MDWQRPGNNLAPRIHLVAVHSLLKHRQGIIHDLLFVQRRLCWVLGVGVWWGVRVLRLCVVCGCVCWLGCRLVCLCRLCVGFRGEGSGL